MARLPIVRTLELEQSINELAEQGADLGAESEAQTAEDEARRANEPEQALRLAAWAEALRVDTYEPSESRADQSTHDDADERRCKALTNRDTG